MERIGRAALRRGATRAAAGARDGAVATAAMSGAMWAASRAGWLGRPPPKTITERALAAVGARGVPEEASHAVAAAAHLGFGAGAGVLFAAARRRSRAAGLAALQGALFGAAVWAVSYAGWIPATGILPPPHRDREGRPWAMFLSHLVFGATLGLLDERRRRARAPGTSRIG
jgi:hypothetical protein